MYLLIINSRSLQIYIVSKLVSDLFLISPLINLCYLCH